MSGRGRSYELVDDGCAVASSCFHCPLPDCKYDTANGMVYHREELRRVRDNEITTAYGKGSSVPELATQFQVSERTIQRVVSAA